jgi:hypothetical protein
MAFSIEMATIIVLAALGVSMLKLVLLTRVFPMLE